MYRTKGVRLVHVMMGGGSGHAGRAGQGTHVHSHVVGDVKIGKSRPCKPLTAFSLPYSQPANHTTF
jgi:hypothetical protein